MIPQQPVLHLVFHDDLRKRSLGHSSLQLSSFSSQMPLLPPVVEA